MHWYRDLRGVLLRIMSSLSILYSKNGSLPRYQGLPKVLHQLTRIILKMTVLLTKEIWLCSTLQACSLHTKPFHLVILSSTYPRSELISRDSFAWHSLARHLSTPSTTTRLLDNTTVITPIRGDDLKHKTMSPQIALSKPPRLAVIAYWTV